MEEIKRQTGKYHPRYQRKRRYAQTVLAAFCMGVILTLAVTGMVSLWHIAGKEEEKPAVSFTTDPEETEVPMTQLEVTVVPTTNPQFGKVPEVVATFAKENNLLLTEYPDDLLELLQKNPETEDFVLHYPLEHLMEREADISAYADEEGIPLLMQWDRQWGYRQYAGEMAGISGCGPLCLSMVGFYLTGDDYTFRPDRVLEFAETNGYCVTGKGSTWTLIGEGAAQLGLDVTEIPLDQNRIENNLEVGNPIICVMGPGDFTTTGHFIVLTGLQDGKFTVNDPNSRENSGRLWSYREIKDQIDNLWVIRYFG